jgi:hypothetical protein
MTKADNAPKTEAATEATPVAAGTASGEAETTGGEHLASHDAASGEAETTGGEHLASHDAASDFRSRWEVIQQGFVDDPRSAVKDADSIVGDVLEELYTTFEEQRRHLEGQWSDGEPDTEELRLALRRYRDFFDRLLNI